MDLLKLDFGCGPNPKPGFEGVDRYPFDGKVKWVLDVVGKRRVVPLDLDTGRPQEPCEVFDPWPWKDSSVDEAHASHFLEHLTNLGGKWERVRFFNELYRVLKPGAGCLLIFPHWASNRYYGDPTHCEPFSEMGFFYLSREWRLAQAPHTDASVNPDGYSCDFEANWGYNLHPVMSQRSGEWQQFAASHYLEVRQDIVATVKARK